MKNFRRSGHNLKTVKVKMKQNAVLISDFIIRLWLQYRYQNSGLVTEQQSSHQEKVELLQLSTPHLRLPKQYESPSQSPSFSPHGVEEVQHPEP